MIDYVSRKYGSEKVVQIVTFGTLGAKGVIRDVGRVMDLPYAYVDSIAKLVPGDLNITLDQALEKNPELNKLYREEEQVRKLIDMCRRLEGLPRNTGMHAAGVVICPEAADEFVPLSRGGDGSITTQYTKDPLEELGLLKMDFLGLRNLTVIRDAVRFVEQTRGIKLDMDHIDFNDPKVLSYIGTGRTEGIFQLESGGMKSFMKELRPQNFEDIVAGISLYRPGPMDFIPKYIKGKNNGGETSYACPQLEPILKNTYGCMVYQEQVMQIVRDLGGYTMGRSDLVRRAMSKKKHSVMEKERANFVYGSAEEGVPGCLSRGIDEKTANRIFDEMMDFANYAFNKSHAACYAVVTLQTAWLKYYYPVEFMAALLTSVIDNPKKVSEYILASRSMGINILPPDINQGEAGFSVDEGNIRYALTAIKGVGRPVIEAIVEERRLRGPYTNLKDFITRVADRDVNKRAIENFIKAGAMDGLGGTRKQCMSVYVQILDHIVKDKKNNLAGQLTLFDIASEEDKEEFDIRMPDVGEYTREMLFAFEKEVMGIYVSGHPLEEYQELLQKYATFRSSDFALDEETGQVAVTDRAPAVIGGMIAEKTIKYTRNNQVMAFISLEDLVGSVEVVVFPRDYEQYSALLTDDAKIFIRGRVSVEEDKDAKLICEQIAGFEEAARGGELFPRRGRSFPGGSSGGWRSGGNGYRGAGQGAAPQGTSPQEAVPQGTSQQESVPQGTSPQEASQQGVKRQEAAGQGATLQSTPGKGRTSADGAGGVPEQRQITGNGGETPPHASGTRQGTARPRIRSVPPGVWVQFPTLEAYMQSERRLLEVTADSDGQDHLVVFIKNSKAVKVLPDNRNVCGDEALVQRLGAVFGEENVKIVTKPIENPKEMH